MILESTSIDPAELVARTGWETTPEGLCKEDRCIPAPGAVNSDGTLDLAVVADRLGMALVHERDRGIVAVGPEGGGRALVTATAPDITLPDIDGNPFSLSSLHGRKVLLVAWASW